MTVWNPVDYRRNSAQQEKWARELFAKLELLGDEHVLDIGSGDGKVTAQLASLVPNGKVIGLDRSAAMVRFASEAFPALEHPNLSFVEGDASNLTFAEELDVIFSNATLHWIYDHAPILAGIFRALRPGGRILVQMGGQGCAADVIETFR
jgi:trans-aconitate 2-methyltransferase